MKTQHIIIIALTALIISVPPTTGYFLSRQVSKKFQEIAKYTNVEANGFKFSLKSFKLGYLSSRYVIETELKNGEKYLIPVSASNVPDLKALKDMQVRFNFSGKLPKAEIEFSSKNVTSLGPNLQKVSLEGISAKGAFFLPKGLETTFVVDKVTTPSDIGVISELNLRAKSLSDETWETSASIRKLKFNAPMGKLEINKIAVTGIIDKNRFKSDLNFEIISSFFSFPKGVKFKTNADFEFKDFKSIDRSMFAKISESNIDISLIAQLMINDSLLEGKANLQFRNLKEKAPNQSVNVQGELKLDLTEKDKTIGPFPFLVQMMNARAEELMENYKIDLKKNPVIVPFKLVNKDVYINGVRYFNCPPMSDANPKLSVSKISDIPIPKIKEDAIEDLLVEETKGQLAESYCRLKYAVDFREPKDPELNLLKELIDAKINFKMLNVVSMLFEQKKKDVANAASDPKIPEELKILANALPCFIDPKSELCLKKESFYSYENATQTLTKWLQLYHTEAPREEDVNALVTHAVMPDHIRKIYTFFQFKILNRIHLKNGAFPLITENLEIAKNAFSRNFIRYEKAYFTCRTSGNDGCINFIEQQEPDIQNSDVRKIYLDYKLSAINMAMMNNAQLSCRQMINDLWMKVSGSKADANPFMMKPDWWQNHPGLAYTESECKKKEFANSSLPGK